MWVVVLTGRNLMQETDWYHRVDMFMMKIVLVSNVKAAPYLINTYSLLNYTLYFV